MWNQPYLETCCRSALHRVWLSGAQGRPGGLKDGKCLLRMERMGLVCERPDSRFEITAPGLARHAQEIANQAA